MSTAIDVKAMMRAERERARAEAAAAREAAGGPWKAMGERAWTGEAEMVDDGLFLVRDFVDGVEARQLADALDTDDGWTDLGSRQLKNLGGTPSADARTPMVPEPLPAPARAVAARLRRLPAAVVPPDFAPNHVLLNKYAPNQGIAPHQDGPRFEPRVAILSLGSDRELCFARRSGDADMVQRVAAPARSLLVFSGAYYTDLFHHVPAGEQERMSLTLRRVVNVSEDAESFTAAGRDDARRAAASFLRSVSEHG